MLVVNEIAEDLKLSAKPIIKTIYNSKERKLLVIGLGKGVLFAEHVAPSTAKLMMIQGEINFNTAKESLHFEAFKSYDIPLKMRHSVVGVSDAIFLLLLEKP